MASGSSLSTSETTGSRVYETLRTEILTGRFPPNQRINIDRLRVRLDVSLSPLREALARLASTGLVLPISRGYQVATLSREDLEDLGRTRRHVEKAAIGDAIRHGDADWEADVARAYYALSRVARPEGKDPESWDEWETRHKAFHRSLLSGCGSSRLLDFWETLFDQGRRYRLVAQQCGLLHGDSPTEHRQLFELATSRNLEATLALIDKHVGVAVRLLAELLNEEPAAYAKADARRASPSPPSDDDVLAVSGA